MAPGRKRATQNNKEEQQPTQIFTTRLTRGAARRATQNSVGNSAAEPPSKADTSKKKKRDKATNNNDEKGNGLAAPKSGGKEAEDAAAEPPKKRGRKAVNAGHEKKAVKAAVMKKEKSVVEGDGEVDNGVEHSGFAAASKTIIIEHCKQCNSFKTRAFQVREGLEKGVSGITVLVNPEKPRRGCFEIREEGGIKFISLLDMKRPFKPMKDLDMEQVIADIINRIQT